MRYHRQRGGSHLLAKWKTCFFYENLSKLCAEGAIQNLLNILHFLPEDMNIFWKLATSDLITLMKSLNESFFPMAILTPSLGIDLIQKCLWILRKKFKFQTTKKINYKHFQCLKQSLKALLEIKFLMLISVESKLATYHHVVVVWREMVIDYESMWEYPLMDISKWWQYLVISREFTVLNSPKGIWRFLPEISLFCQS